MSANQRKRKHRATHQNRHRDYEISSRSEKQEQFTFLGHHQSYLARQGSGSQLLEEPDVDPLQDLCIQAHEADIIRGPSAVLAAQSLEAVEYQTTPGSDANRLRDATSVVPRIGSALIQWNGGRSASSVQLQVFPDDDDEEEATTARVPLTKQKDHRNLVWVDRYDARLLLDALPVYAATHSLEPSSPTGWSDLSSDAEDTFFFSPDEVDEFRKEKRRRSLDRTREERLRARMEEDGVDEDESYEQEDIWGGSDEEPDDVQKELMTRTAAHLLTSPNAAQLEMRILANHGGDRRFAFLRGRWSKAWNLAKAKTRLEKQKEQEKKEALDKKPAGLGVLDGYGSEGSASGDGDDADKPNSPDARELDEKISKPVLADVNNEELAREARRRRLKAWVEQRRTAKQKGK